MANSLTFQNHSLDIISRNGAEWIRGDAICATLGYKDSQKALKDIYTRHKDEFTDSMTRLIKVGTNGGAQMVRVFSLRGAHLLAIFSRTPVAKQFRKWVLDILEAQNTAASPSNLPVQRGKAGEATPEQMEDLRKRMEHCQAQMRTRMWWKEVKRLMPTPGYEAGREFLELAVIRMDDAITELTR